MNCGWDDCWFLSFAAVWCDGRCRRANLDASESDGNCRRQKRTRNTRTTNRKKIRYIHLSMNLSIHLFSHQFETLSFIDHDEVFFTSVWSAVSNQLIRMMMLGFCKWLYLLIIIKTWQNSESSFILWCHLWMYGPKVISLISVHFLNFPAQSCNARVKVYGDCCPRSTDRVVQINGGPVDIVNCIATIVDVVIVVRVLLSSRCIDANACSSFFSLYPDHLTAHRCPGLLHCIVIDASCNSSSI